MRYLSALAVFMLLGAGLQAQDLSVTITGDLASGLTIDMSVTGAPASSPTVILASLDDTGFSVGPLLSLGIGPMVVPVAFGTSDANGDFSFSQSFPALPAGVTPPTIDLFAQALSIGGGFPMPSFATSDVEAFTIN